jgi:glutamate formiminotransferase
MKLLECVPNVSEGRDPEKIEALVEVLRSSSGVALLDYSSDADHNRSVFTYVGEPQKMLAATLDFCATAYDLIDMRAHVGCHPRLGAVDVVPFIPLKGMEKEEAVRVAHTLGEAIGAMGVPVYFYEDAARIPERSNLADVRRGEYERLEERLATPEGRPDAGPTDFDPQRGATIVGARFPLIAFNVNLGTSDLAVAQAIARAVRHSNGGFRYVKALGMNLKDRGQVQVSMNLVNYEQSPIHRVVDTIRSEAARYGVSVVECELIGMAPLGAFEESIRHYLQIRDFSSEKIIEARLLDAGLGET